MADISMCLNSGCRKRATCYRYNATENPWRQSYGKFHEDTPTIPCEYYWRMPKYETNRSRSNSEGDKELS